MRVRETGLTMIELVMVLAVAGILTVVAVSGVTGAMRRYALNGAVQTVAAEIRSARFAAVANNRTIRVRFNCPGPGQFRTVEVVNNPAIDNAGNRCSDATYPFPQPNPAVLPNADGPVIQLPQGAQLGAFQDLEFTTRGRVTPLTACPACAATAPPATISLTNGNETQAITVAAGGQVRVP